MSASRPLAFALSVVLVAGCVGGGSKKSASDDEPTSSGAPSAPDPTAATEPTTADPAPPTTPTPASAPARFWVNGSRVEGIQLIYTLPSAKKAHNFTLSSLSNATLVKVVVVANWTSKHPLEDKLVLRLYDANLEVNTVSPITLASNSTSIQGKTTLRFAIESSGPQGLSANQKVYLRTGLLYEAES